MLLQALTLYARIARKDTLWVSMQHSRLTRLARMTIWRPVENAATSRLRSRLPRPIDARNGAPDTAVHKYWNAHTIWQGPFLSREASLRYIKELTE